MIWALPIDYLSEIKIIQMYKVVSHSVDFPGFPETPNSSELCCSLSLTNYYLLFSS